MLRKQRLGHTVATHTVALVLCTARDSPQQRLLRVCRDRAKLFRPE